MAALTMGALPTAVSVTLLPASKSQRNRPYGSVKRASSMTAITVRASASEEKEEAPSSTGKAALRVAMATAAAAAISLTVMPETAHAGLIDELLAKSSQNKELNDAKRLATSGANASRPWTVEFGTCRFPENITGCDDLARSKKVAFITDDLELECEGKEAGKCASNNLWNARSSGLAKPGGGGAAS